MELKSGCNYCKSKEHTIEKCKKVVCYICKGNHHFTEHNETWYKPKMWAEFQTGLKIHKDYLDTQWKLARELFEKKSLELSYIDNVLVMARKDHSHSTEASVGDYRNTKVEELRNITARLTELTRNRDNFYKQLKQFEHHIEVLRNPGRLKEAAVVCSICYTTVPNRVLLCCGNVLCDNCEKKQLKDRRESEFGIRINTDCPFCKEKIRTAKLVI